MASVVRRVTSQQYIDPALVFTFKLSSVEQPKNVATEQLVGVIKELATYKAANQQYYNQQAKHGFLKRHCLSKTTEAALFDHRWAARLALTLIGGIVLVTMEGHTDSREVRGRFGGHDVLGGGLIRCHAIDISAA